MCIINYPAKYFEKSIKYTYEVKYLYYHKHFFQFCARKWGFDPCVFEKQYDISAAPLNAY